MNQIPLRIRQPLASTSKACYGCVAREHRRSIHDVRQQTKATEIQPTGFIARVRSLFALKPQQQPAAIFNSSYASVEQTFTVKRSIDRKIKQSANKQLVALLAQQRRRLRPAVIWATVLALRSRNSLHLVPRDDLKKTGKSVMAGFTARELGRRRQLSPESIRKLGARILGIHKAVLKEAAETGDFAQHRSCFHMLCYVGSLPEIEELLEIMRKDGTIENATTPRKQQIYNLYGLGILRWRLALTKRERDARKLQPLVTKLQSLLYEMQSANLNTRSIDSFLVRLVKEQDRLQAVKKRMLARKLQTQGFSIEMVPIGSELPQLSRHTLNTVLTHFGQERQLSKAIATFELAQSEKNGTVGPANTYTFNTLMAMAKATNNRLIAHFVVRSAVDLSQSQIRSFRRQILAVARRKEDKDVRRGPGRPLEIPLVNLNDRLVRNLLDMHLDYSHDPLMRETLRRLSLFSIWLKAERAWLVALYSKRRLSGVDSTLEAAMLKHLRLTRKSSRAFSIAVARAILPLERKRTRDEARNTRKRETAQILKKLEEERRQTARIENAPTNAAASAITAAPMSDSMKSEQEDWGSQEISAQGMRIQYG